MSNPPITNEFLRSLLRYEFDKGTSAPQAVENICTTYGEGIVGRSWAFKWYSRFKSGDTGLQDAPRSGRPVEFDEEHLEAILEENSRQTTRELAEEMECDHSTVVRHLQKMGKVQKLGAWVPHHLNAQQKEKRLKVCTELLKRYQASSRGKRPFLSLFVTGMILFVLSSLSSYSIQFLMFKAFRRRKMVSICKRLAAEGVGQPRRSSTAPCET